MSFQHDAATSSYITATIKRVRVQDPAKPSDPDLDGRLAEWAQKERIRRHRHRPVSDLQRMLIHLLDPKPGEEARWRRFALQMLADRLGDTADWDKAVSVVDRDRAGYLNTVDAAYWTKHIKEAVRSGKVDPYCQVNGIDHKSLYRAWHKLRSLGAEVPPCNILPRKLAGTYQLNTVFESNADLEIIVAAYPQRDCFDSDLPDSEEEQPSRQIARELLRLIGAIGGPAQEERLLALDRLWGTTDDVCAWNKAVAVRYQDEVGILDAQDVPYWIRHINAAVATQNINDYCRQREISHKTLYRWWDSLLILGADVPHKNLPQK